jgi:cysteine synthase A
MSLIRPSILATIGNTPVVRINNLAPQGIEMFVKLEAFNPLGSVKDRIALGIIEAAERDGRLQPGQTVIEATSGNTGIGLALVCAQKGYPLVIVMAESFSVERRRLLRFLGAKVVLTPAASKGSGMIEKAVQLAERHGWFLCRQFDNPANVETHASTTAEEILSDFGPDGLDYFVSGLGTGGTMLGVASVLKTRSPSTRIIGCEPDNAQILASGRVDPMRPDGVPSFSHPVFRPHPMQGWTPDFVPPFAAKVLESKLVDAVEPVSGSAAISWSRKLASIEGIFCGITSGATFAAAMSVADRAPRGSRILAMLPDTGERYLSTPLFADIPEQMTDEELALSKSTPGHRFEGSVQLAIVPPRREVADEDTAALDALINAVKEPVVVFGLEWCEFSWSVHRFLRQANIPFTAINLDSCAYREERKGEKLRWALRNKVASATLPQVFLSGRHIGGAIETLAAFRDGALKKELDTLGLTVSGPVLAGATEYLPNWIQPRLGCKLAAPVSDY